MTEREWLNPDQVEVIYCLEGAMFHTDAECVAEFFKNYHELQEEVAGCTE